MENANVIRTIPSINSYVQRWKSFDRLNHFTAHKLEEEVKRVHNQAHYELFLILIGKR